MLLSYEGKDPLGKGKWKRTMFSLDGYTSHLFKSKSEFKQKKSQETQLSISVLSWYGCRSQCVALVLSIHLFKLLLFII